METINLLEAIQSAPELTEHAVHMVDLLVDQFANDPKPFPPPEPIKCPIFTF
jgi:hypothetical protein